MNIFQGEKDCRKNFHKWLFSSLQWIIHMITMWYYWTNIMTPFSKKEIKMYVCDMFLCIVSIFLIVFKLTYTSIQKTLNLHINVPCLLPTTVFYFPSLVQLVPILSVSLPFFFPTTHISLSWALILWFLEAL